MSAKKSSQTMSDHRSPEEQALHSSDPDDYMNEQHRQFFRTRLLAMREELLAAEQETNCHLKEQDNTPDPLDRATIEENLTLELRLRDRERRLLTKVEQALQRIEDGTYGWCAETDEPIGLARLLSRPTATLCLEAQQHRERIQQIFGQ